MFLQIVVHLLQIVFTLTSANPQPSNLQKVPWFLGVLSTFYFLPDVHWFQFILLQNENELAET